MQTDFILYLRKMLSAQSLVAINLRLFTTTLIVYWDFFLAVLL